MSNTPGFYTLSVKELKRETADAVTIFFEIPEALKSTFAYQAGQYLTLQTIVNGEAVRRAYSLCSAPEIDLDLAVTVKKVTQGKMSTYINEVLKVGDTLEVMPPNGKFIVEPNAERSQTYILFGGGSGITPLMGITKTILQKEKNSKIFLVYANQNQDSVIFKNELESIEKENKDRFKIIYSYDKAPMMWFGLKGFLTEKTVGETVKVRIGGSWLDAKFYICGPSQMMEIVKKGLQLIGVPTNNVFTEYFTSVSSTQEKTEIISTSENTPFKGKANVRVTVYGNTNEISVKENQTILDAANAAGLQPPYSCTVGVCTTCRAKVTKGSVEMLEREGLSDSEIEEGYVLTCQSIPTSNEIELIYE
jgi:ring-1,2-phenylacetyl-CoA epoxidase subunit PaaE